MAENESHSLKQDLDALRDDFQSLTQDVRQISEEQARSGAQVAREKGSDLTGEVCRRSKQLGAVVDNRPVTSLATALGAGVVLGAFLKR